MRFDELRLGESIVRAVAAAGYERPTPIQVQAVPPVLDGRDVLGCAQTGTGKTAAFAMPILKRLSDSVAELSLEGVSTPQGRRSAGRGQGGGRRRSSPDSAPRRRGARDGRSPRALVLCPTRELATQIHESFETYGQFLPLDHTVVFGGVSQFHQVESLRAGVDVLVATPGRLQDLMNQGHVDLSRIETLVLDEADQMLDMGFINDIRRIVARTPRDRQTLFFSATMPPEIRQLADAILTDPVSIETTPVATPATAIEQSVFMVNRPQKPALLIELLRSGDMDRTLVFTRTKYGADKLVKVLSRAGLDAAAIHGNKTQGQRTKALAAFKSGRTPVLVATDIAARGIDVDAVSHVVNFDIPAVPETYVHRIGRTARGGASGKAIALCDAAERPLLKAIERLTGRSPKVSRHEMITASAAPAEDASPAAPASRNGSAPRTPRQGRGPKANAGRGGRGTRDANPAGATRTKRSSGNPAGSETSSPPAPRNGTGTGTGNGNGNGRAGSKGGGTRRATPKPATSAAKAPAEGRRDGADTPPAGRPAGAPRKRIPRRDAVQASGRRPAPRGTATNGGGSRPEGRADQRQNGNNGGGGRPAAAKPSRGGSQPSGTRGSSTGTNRSGGSRSSGGPRGQRTNGGRPAATQGSRHGSRTRSGTPSTGTSGTGSSGRQNRRG